MQPWLVGDKETLEKVHEKAVKMVSGLKSKDYKERCLELGLETLEKRREEQDMALVHKMALEGQLSKIFEVVEAHDRPRTRQTEGEYRLVQKFARTDPRKYSFAVRVVDPWNRLPDDLKLANSKEHFKAKMKRLKMLQVRGQAGASKHIRDGHGQPH